MKRNDSMTSIHSEVGHGKSGKKKRNKSKMNSQVRINSKMSVSGKYKGQPPTVIRLPGSHVETLVSKRGSNEFGGFSPRHTQSVPTLEEETFADEHMIVNLVN